MHNSELNTSELKNLNVPLEPLSYRLIIESADMDYDIENKYFGSY